MDWLFSGFMEDVAEFVKETVLNILMTCAKFTWDLMASAFVTEQITDDSWQVVRGEDPDKIGGWVQTWVTVMAPICVGIVCIQVVIAMFKRSRGAMARAGAGAVLAIPGSFVAVWFVEKLAKAMDQVALFLGDSLGIIRSMFSCAPTVSKSCRKATKDLNRTFLGR